MSPLLWIGLLGGAAFLLTRSSPSSGSCAPAAPTSTPPIAPGTFMMAGILWDPVACTADGETDFMSISQADVDNDRSKIGTAPTNAMPVPAGRVAYVWFFDDQNHVVLALKREGGGVVTEI